MPCVGTTSSARRYSVAVWLLALAATHCKRAPPGEVGPSASASAAVSGSSPHDAFEPLPADLTAAPLDGYTELALTGSGGCAIHASKRVACWGDRIHGQGTEWRSSQVPAWVAGLDSITRLSTGASAVCATRESGETRCFGLGPWGTSAAGNYAFVPTRAPHLDGLTMAMSPELGTGHGCGISAEGEVSCWGEGRVGATGIGEAPGFNPVGVILRATAGRAVSVACGRRHACAQLASGQLICWGYGEGGALGDGVVHQRHCTFYNAPSAPGVLPGPQLRKCDGPEPVFLPRLALAVGAIRLLAPNGQCAVTSESLRCWGKGWAASPVDVSTGAPVAEIVELAGHDEVVCARSRAGEVTCLGEAPSGHLRFTPPRAVPELRGAKRLAARGLRVCAIVAGGGVRCIGKNPSGLELVDWTTR